MFDFKEKIKRKAICGVIPSQVTHSVVLAFSQKRAMENRHVKDHMCELQ